MKKSNKYMGSWSINYGQTYCADRIYTSLSVAKRELYREAIANCPIGSRWAYSIYAIDRPAWEGYEPIIARFGTR